MLRFLYSRWETGEIHIPFLNLVVSDLTGQDPLDYANEVVAQEVGHNQFILVEGEPYAYEYATGDGQGVPEGFQPADQRDADTTE